MFNIACDPPRLMAGQLLWPTSFFNTDAKKRFLGFAQNMDTNPTPICNSSQPTYINIRTCNKRIRHENTGKENPRPTNAFTPGLTKGMVREHAFKLFRDKLHAHHLTLDDWVFAEKDLVQTMEADGLLKR